MFDNLVTIEPEDIEAYLGTAKVVISLCDHKVAIGEDPHRVNGGACRRMKHQFPDAGRAIRDLQIVLRIAAGIDVGKRTGISRFQALQKGGHPVDLLGRRQLGSESGPTGNRKHRQSAYCETLLHCQSSFGVAYKPIDAAAQGWMHNYEPGSSLFFVSEPTGSILPTSPSRRRVHRLFTCGPVRNLSPRAVAFRPSGAHPSFPRTVVCPASRWGCHPPSP